MTSAPSRIAASVASTLSAPGAVRISTTTSFCARRCFKIRRLVLAAALRQQLDDRILAVRPARAAFGDREIELAQMDAAQVIREVGRGEPQQLGD